MDSPSTPTKTVFKSAFGHSLRSSAPIPVPEHLSHFTCAVLQGLYTFKVGKNEQNGRLCLELAMPDYSVVEGGAAVVVEGELVLEEGVEVDQEAQKMLAQLRATTTPCGMVRQNSRGALKAMFDDLSSVELSGVEGVAELKAASVEIVKKALQALQGKSESVEGRTIIEMDALIAEAERQILSDLVAAAAASANAADLLAYLQRAVQLHAALELDDTIDSDPPMGGCCGGDGGCCGEEGGCCDDGDCGECDDEHDHDGDHHDHEHGHGCCHDHGH